MAVAQMNWGRMRYPLTDARMSEFSEALDRVYRAAETHPGFIWRIPDQDAEQQLRDLGMDEKTSATVSVWTDADALRDYTFSGQHGCFLNRASEWFEAVDGPQLVLWQVEATAKPTFTDAFRRLNYLKTHGNTAEGYGWHA